MPNIESEGNSIEAVCPKCNRHHKVYTFWTGKGKPKIYCELCLRNFNNHEGLINGTNTLA